MLICILLFIVEGLISIVVKQFVGDLDHLSLYLVSVNSIILFFALPLVIKDKTFYRIIIVGYIARLSLLFIDYYGRSLIILPHSGSDTEGFYRQGIRIANDLNLFGKMAMGAYTDFLGAFFLVFGDQRLLAQYFNTILGIGIIVAVYRVLNLIGVRYDIKRNIVLLITFFPQAMIFSGVLLRENLVSFGMIMMAYYLVKWYKESGMANMLLSVIYLGVAVYFHSGVVGAFLPLAFLFTTYCHQAKVIKFSGKSVILLCLFSAVAILGSIKFGDVIFNKFGNVDLTSESFYKSMSNTIDAGSKYLEWVTYGNFYDIVLYSPLKMFYFLFSPVPMDWRGLIDIITFFLDSIIYFIATTYIIRFRNHSTEHRPLIIILIFILTIVIFTFAFGTIAAGTAVRHRNKILAVILIVFAMVMENKKRSSENIRIDKKMNYNF